MQAGLPDTKNSTRLPAYTSAVFSETRYALNGDLHVAYRASREGPRDLVFVSPWITNCEVFPELPSIQGWVEALQMMKVGDEWEIVIPSALGYGEQGAGGVIPPNQTLVFQMALLNVQPEGSPAAAW